MKYIMRKFNLMEIMIAMGLLAVGLVAVMGLVPIALVASRDAMAETAAAETADLLLNQVRGELKLPGQWEEITKDLPKVKPLTNIYEVDYDNTAFATGGSRPEYQILNGTGGSIIRLNGSSSQGVYRLIRYSRLTGSSDEAGFEKYNPERDALDFEADALLWCETVRLTGAGEGASAITLSDSVAVSLRLEISWPSNLPYNRRRKTNYILDVFRNK